MTHHEKKVFKQRFQLGKMSITAGALSKCKNNNIDYIGLSMRHATGDFGIVGHLDNVQLTHSERQHGEYVTYDGLKLNAIAIESQQGKVLSIYTIHGHRDSKIWIKTLFVDKEMQTTILLPNEYHHSKREENMLPALFLTIALDTSLQQRVSMFLVPSKHGESIIIPLQRAFCDHIAAPMAFMISRTGC